MSRRSAPTSGGLPVTVSTPGGTATTTSKGKDRKS
eukprot:CAMPEP_0181061456 /NCGR_PEP_ID=MMETSP1070-20121207/22533_1 /TAXON_ID=265543 /ORGANISM="Minutocellus polymorphus, Strain NH13" /LENGTH=34 /DNA_ID= /DNA_START= /DNA_END= /DNA_ORIENTATION=